MIANEWHQNDRQSDSVPYNLIHQSETSVYHFPSVYLH